MVPIDHPGAVALQVIDDKPAEIVERFFLEVVRPRFNGRVLSLAIVGLPRYGASNVRYSVVSHAKFGRLSRWRKDRVSRNVWYVDAELAEAYVGLAPMCAPKALTDPATIAKGAH